MGGLRIAADSAYYRTICVGPVTSDALFDAVPSSFTIDPSRASTHKVPSIRYGAFRFGSQRQNQAVSSIQRLRPARLQLHFIVCRSDPRALADTRLVRCFSLSRIVFNTRSRIRAEPVCETIT